MNSKHDMIEKLMSSVNVVHGIYHANAVKTGAAIIRVLVWKTEHLQYFTLKRKPAPSGPVRRGSIERNDIRYAAVGPSSRAPAPSCEDPSVTEGAGGVADGVIVAAGRGNQGCAAGCCSCILHAARQVIQEHLRRVMLRRETRWSDQRQSK